MTHFYYAPTFWCGFYLFGRYAAIILIKLMLLASFISFSSIALAKTTKKADLEYMVAQKLVIDLRYYCSTIAEGKKCQQPLTKLPPELANMISNTNIGGVILFADNLVNIEQMVTLTHDLQVAASKSSSKTPLFISIDQEGGRVARIPRHLSTAFTGNMSIGATFHKHKTKFAEQTGSIIADQLNALGFNLNFAPTVDVNVNPENPVINVRSFGENANTVAILGLAQLQAMQKQGVMATLKHFPGHGDTNVDSHTGLPVVNHDLNTINSIDLLPFKYAIDNGDPAMIMTAHIQYPQLDNTTFVAKDGAKMIKPATMSRKILTDLLRNQMGFKGVIITDALDMAGISHFFNPTQAVIETFNAGADIALMPIAIRQPSDIAMLSHLISEVSQQISTKLLVEAEMKQSLARILNLKNHYLNKTGSIESLSTSILHATQVLAEPKHNVVEQQLAEQAITLVNNEKLIPLNAKYKNIHLMMPDASKCMAFEQALITENATLSLSCTSLATTTIEQAKLNIEKADLIISANITPKQSAVEMGGMDDLAKIAAAGLTKVERDNLLEDLMRYANNNDIPMIYISLRTPYDIEKYGKYSQASLASYAYNTDVKQQANITSAPSGAAYHALAKVILGKISANGRLPVTLISE